MKRVELITKAHQTTRRDYWPRMKPGKEKIMAEALKYSESYWDGDRIHGYGGYKYDGRWSSVASNLVETFRLNDQASILDLGCGKGHLLYELWHQNNSFHIEGIDISQYAINNAKSELGKRVRCDDLRNNNWIGNKNWDMLLSINVLHNLEIRDLFEALEKIETSAKQKYIVVESYETELDLLNLQCWSLTCKSFYSVKDWEWIFKKTGYTGSYEFIFFR